MLIGLVPIARRAVMVVLAGIPFSVEMLMTVAAIGAVIINAGEEAAAVVFLSLVGELLEGVAAGKARSSIQALTMLVPETAFVEEGVSSEFMPNLDEGTLMYMPTTLPGISVTKAAELMQMQDRIIKSFPEVESVFGKAGRAQTATDPAPTEMFETIINLKPKSEWRPGVTSESLKTKMDAALQFPGVSNTWTIPISETLVVMQSLPFALVGSIWLMWWLGFNMSVAVAVGFIALSGAHLGRRRPSPTDRLVVA